MAKKKKNLGGRPPKRPQDKVVTPVRVIGRVDDEPWQTIKDGAAEAEKQTGKNFTQWAVGLLLKEAKRILTAARRQSREK